MPRRKKPNFDVFINCPFDKEYRAIFDAVVFAVLDCGFRPRSALEFGDGGAVRIIELMRLMRSARYGVHDLSRVELDPENGLPRLNMALELGIFLGLRHSGSRTQKNKKCVIMDSEKYRYQEYCSDIAGQDVKAHGNDTKKAISVIHAWLKRQVPTVFLPSAGVISKRYEDFQQDLPVACKDLNWSPQELDFLDLRRAIELWLKKVPAKGLT